MKILIVEDETNLANTLSRALQFTFGAHAKVLLCKTGELAIKYLSEETFDLLITDWHLPGISGLALASQARKSFPNLKIVFMTATHVSEIEQRVRQVADIYITKPFGIPVLTEEINSLF